MGQVGGVLFNCCPCYPATPKLVYVQCVSNKNGRWGSNIFLRQQLIGYAAGVAVIELGSRGSTL